MLGLDWIALFREFVTIAVVVDPIGTVPIFIAVTTGMRAVTRRRIAVRSVLVAGIVLLFFLVLGQIVFESIGLALGSFQIAGGIVLFLFALSMIFGESKTEAEIAEFENDTKRDLKDKAVFPLAIPSIASPGAMLAVIILTDNHRHSLAEQAVTVGLLLLVLFLTLLLLLVALPIQKMIGTAGASIISRVMGIILSTVAVDSVINGLASLGIVTLSS